MPLACYLCWPLMLLIRFVYFGFADMDDERCRAMSTSMIQVYYVNGTMNEDLYIVDTFDLNDCMLY